MSQSITEGNYYVGDKIWGRWEISFIKFILLFFFFRNDVDSALKIFQDTKEQGLFIRDSACLLLLNTMAKSGQTEHFESGMLFVYFVITTICVQP